MFLQQYEEIEPNTYRLHQFDDAVFIPDVMTGYTIDSEDADAMVIQNLDGSVKISMDATRIKFTMGASTITITDGNIDVVGATITSDSDIDTTADMNADNVTATTEVTAATNTLTGHTHLENGEGEQTNPPTPGT